jgi:hypothetical protein
MPNAELAHSSWHVMWRARPWRHRWRAFALDHTPPHVARQVLETPTLLPVARLLPQRRSGPKRSVDGAWVRPERDARVPEAQPLAPSGAGSSYRRTTWLNGTARSLSFRAGSTLAIACAIWPQRSIFIDVRRAADGWIAATLARCSTMKGHYRIRPTIGANKI